MKIGIIGMGKAGRRYAEIAGKEHQVRSADACHPERSMYWGAGELIDWADAIIIATPPHAHVGYAVWAALKPVLLEKPIAESLEDCAALLDLRDALTVPVTTYRFHPAAQLAKFEYREGDDIRIIYREHIDNWQAETYERDADLEARIHFVDMLYWIGGPELAKRHRELVELDFQTPGERDCRVLINNKPFELYPCPDAHVAQFQHFVACVEGRDRPVCSLEEAIEVLEICLGQ